MIKTRTQKIALLGVLGALALALSAAESFLMPDIAILPPGAKPGLSNIVTMFAASCVSWLSAIYIVIIKAVFALVTRGVTAFLMSITGGILSALVMIILLKGRKDSISFIGIGILSALMHNFGQLLVSFFMTGTSAVMGYAPFLILFGALTGFVTGSILKIIIPAIEKAVKK